MDVQCSEKGRSFDAESLVMSEPPQDADSVEQAKSTITNSNTSSEVVPFGMEVGIDAVPCATLEGSASDKNADALNSAVSPATETVPDNSAVTEEATEALAAPEGGEENRDTLEGTLNTCDIDTGVDSAAGENDGVTKCVDPGSTSPAAVKAKWSLWSWLRGKK